MTKADIVQKIQAAVGIDEKAAGALLESVLELLKVTLKNGEAINIIGFGRFSARDKRARQGRNPRTGEPIMVSARRSISFHASPQLKKYVNGEDMPPAASIEEQATESTEAAT